MNNKENATNIPTFDLVVKLTAGPIWRADKSHNTSFHLKMRHLKSSRETIKLIWPNGEKIEIEQHLAKTKSHHSKNNNHSRRPFLNIFASYVLFRGSSKHMLGVFTGSSPTSGCAHSQLMWVASGVTSHCGSGHVFLLRRCSRWCHFLLWVLEKPSGHPWMHLPLPLSCFQCHCARLCIPEGEMQTKFAYCKKTM